jgi:hypothetical protein
MLPVQTPDFPVDDIDPDLLHQIVVALYAVKRKDWAAARGALSGAAGMVDRMRRDEAAEDAIEQKWNYEAHVQIDAAARSIEAGQYALAAGELNGAVALLLLIARS